MNNPVNEADRSRAIALQGASGKDGAIVDGLIYIGDALLTVARELHDLAKKNAG